MILIENSIKVGIESPLFVLHASDTHLTYAYETDGEDKVKLSKERKNNYFQNNELVFDSIKNYARKYGLTVVHSGDLIDFVSQANLDKVKDFTDNCDVFLSAGNHEFARQIGGVTENEEYRNLSLKKVQESFCNDIRFSVRIIDGLKFIAIDNSYYKFDAEHYEKLKEEEKDGLPTVLVIHNPLYEQNLFEFCMKNNPDNYASLVAVPDNMMCRYPKERFEQQRADDTTVKTVEFIKSSRNIKAILCGHIHKNFETMLTPKTKQISTSADTLRLIKFY